jgi:hypothetical protein
VTTMEDFYVTLVSTSSLGLHPNNKCSDFVNKLYKRLDLNDNWEVGVTEMLLPETLCNIANGKTALWIYYNEMLRYRVILHNMFLGSIRLLVNELNKEVIDFYEFSIEDGVVVCTPTAEFEDMKIKFSPGLASQLGFTFYNGYLRGKIVASSAGNIVYGIPRQLCVCSNIVKEQLFADTSLKLLRCIPVDIKNFRHGACMAYTFPNVMYVALSATDIENISILIKDISGLPAPFTVGTSTVVLHFRQKKY